VIVPSGNLSRNQPYGDIGLALAITPPRDHVSLRRPRRAHREREEQEDDRDTKHPGPGPGRREKLHMQHFTDPFFDEMGLRRGG
jgi:hypothetical protein